MAGTLTTIPKGLCMPSLNITQHHLGSPIRERLSGEPVLNDLGEPTQPSQAMVYSPSVPIPTMLADRELNYLSWLARTLKGTGEIIELGCFLGGSTAALVAGVEHNPRVDSKILTYDAFEIPTTNPPGFDEWLKSYGLKPGERFRDRFDHFNRQWQDHICVREGWLPPNADDQQSGALYPEQSPIELLFVDIAKAWDVHLTVLRTFARHLHIGATMVQQDFFDLQTPWIPLHMWQLRDVLEPMDVIFGTPTCSFRCVDTLNWQLESLWSADDFTQRTARHEVWEQVHAYWVDLIGPEAAGFTHGHASMHALHAHDPDDAAHFGRLFESWIRSSQSNQFYFSSAWSGLMRTQPGVLASAGHPSHAFNTLAAESIVRGARDERLRPGERTSYCPLDRRRAVWASTFDRLRSQGHRRIALFGAGQHTRWLLSEFSFDDDLRIMCIVDDEPSATHINAIPVIGSHETNKLLDQVSAILPSSDAFEPQLLTRMHEHFSSKSNLEPIRLELIRVYTHPSEVDAVLPSWRYTVESISPEHRSPVCPKASTGPGVSALAPHRVALGLTPERDWTHTLGELFTPPDWTIDYLRLHETAFLWDLIESTRPQHIVEIGTASGVSTAMLLAASDLFCGPDALVSSFDIAERCYFDPNRPLGSSIGEMMPGQLNRARLYAKVNAVDAASCFEPSSIDFAFIDGNHAHPAPTIDLISLIYALKPGAWVALHDIELSHVRPESTEEQWQHTGAERLFKSWPYAKTQLPGLTSADRNLGAIQMPQHPADAIEHLLDAMQDPWELADDELDTIRLATAIFNEHHP